MGEFSIRKITEKNLLIIFFFVHDQTINEMNGKHSGCMMWPGSDFPYQNVSCSYVDKFDLNATWYSRIDTTLTWFQNTTNPANLAMVYVEEPDRHGHGYSPDSDVVRYLFLLLLFGLIGNLSNAQRLRDERSLIADQSLELMIQSALCLFSCMLKLLFFHI